MAEELVTNNETASQFELAIDGKIALLVYRLKPGSIVFIHTEVPEQLEGHGVGGQLARAGLKFARDNGLSVVPLCPFVSSYMKRHPEYQDLIREDHRPGPAV